MKYLYLQDTFRKAKLLCSIHLRTRHEFALESLQSGAERSANFMTTKAAEKVREMLLKLVHQQ